MLDVGRANKLRAEEVLQKYTDDWLPDFYPRPIEDANQVGFNGDRPIHVACIRSSLDDVLALIEGGADVNAVGDLGYTPLHHAAEDGHSEILNLLLGHGANVNAKNEFGQTPLDLARVGQESRAVEVLELRARS
jgi:uncharacterized protein